MMDDANELLFDFLNNQESSFTSKDFQNFVKQKGGKRVSLQAIKDILEDSDMVFPLVKDEYITRASAFEGRWFSFKPSKEEVNKGWFMIGHRTIPFINHGISPDTITIYSYSKIIKAS